MKRNPQFTAKYAPRDPSELTPEAEEWIGWEGQWEVTHLLDEGPEAGLPLCTVSRELREKGVGYPPVEAFLWVPITDFASIRWSDETLAEADEERDALMKERYGSGETPPAPSE